MEKYEVDVPKMVVKTVARWQIQGAWVAQSVKCLPSAQVMIPGSWDGAPRQAPCSVGSLLLPLPLPLPLLVLSLLQINK